MEKHNLNILKSAICAQKELKRKEKNMKITIETELLTKEQSMQLLNLRDLGCNLKIELEDNLSNEQMKLIYPLLVNYSESDVITATCQILMHFKSLKHQISEFSSEQISKILNCDPLLAMSAMSYGANNTSSIVGNRETIRPSKHACVDTINEDIKKLRINGRYL